jgi:hypothetical protein
MSGGSTSSPMQACAISTIAGASKWACWASGDAHFWTTANRIGSSTDAHRSTLRQPGSPRVSTT